MTYKVRQKDIRALLNYGVALPLREAEKLIESGERQYNDFVNVSISSGVYRMNGLCIEDTTTGQLYADAARISLCFYFHRW